MSVKVKMIRRPPSVCVSEVYDLCNKHQWFTCGSTSAYEKMFSLLRDERPFSEVALAIWICSKDASLAEINQILDEALYTKVEGEEE